MNSVTNQRKSFWRQPAVFLRTKREKLSLITFLTIYIPLFLLIFQPFGVNNYDPTHRIGLEFLLVAVGFGIINGLGTWVYEFVFAPFLFPAPDRLLFIIRICIEFFWLSIITFLLYNVLGRFHDWNIDSFIGFIRDVAVSGIIPLTIIFLYFNYIKTRNAYKVLLEFPKSELSKKEMICLASDNGKQMISLTIDSLLLIEAQDNYVAVFHLENEKIKKTLLRTTMKKLEEKLIDFSIIRCHRSFIVNTRNIQKISSSNNRLKLHIQKLDFVVPVSRKYLSVFENLLPLTTNR
ncbi:LytTR family DNA-binding domain-containing protein [Aquimarina sp. 2201CG5-10]|uniref:LytR/AlgR family response regulator transcription factor n=1 Tax=Aquimarina callyspongiae TaxID=3098150 RepID=UPI002AB5A285|nr:LytTR family DNA-binding domain-containing protein [Aquimarina sp. 2201CG5-10]MDY8135874.1 LytTR family DNA-binding domain-containing protein [Aquimarina sp. 2201CG5-10]